MFDTLKQQIVADATKNLGNLAAASDIPIITASQDNQEHEVSPTFSGATIDHRKGRGNPFSFFMPDLGKLVSHWIGHVDEFDLENQFHVLYIEHRDSFVYVTKQAGYVVIYRNLVGVNVLNVAWKEIEPQLFSLSIDECYFRQIPDNARTNIGAARQFCTKEDCTSSEKQFYEYIMWTSVPRALLEDALQAIYVDKGGNSNE